MPNSTTPLTVAFVLASYTSNAPAGMERTTAALAHGLRQLGHRTLILTCVRSLPLGPDELRLTVPQVEFPCGDENLRHALIANRKAIEAELAMIYGGYGVDIAVYVDALWGLGRVAPSCGVRTVLAMHVVGHDEDLGPSLESADQVIAPSQIVLEEAHDRGYDTTGWQIVPNALLHDHSPPSSDRREALRRYGPIRVLARLGPEKNIPALLDAGRLVDRPVDIIVAEADFETAPHAQAEEWERCKYAASHMRLACIRGEGIAWHAVPSWLAEAAVVIVPSLRESFGLVALEAMSVGTPVVAYGVGNLPALVGAIDGAGGIVVPRPGGEHGLWRAAEHLLADPIRYGHLSRAAYYRSRDFRPTTVAETFLKAVR